MARTIIRKIKFTPFKELSKEEQEEMIENHKYINVDDDWWEFVIEDVNEEFETKYGVSVDGKRLSFDLYRRDVSMPFEISDYEKFFKKYCNGDEKCVKELLKVFDYNNIICEPYYNSFIISFEEFDDEIEEYEKKHSVDLRSEFQEVITELENELFNKLKAEYDYLISDEAVRETLIANDFGKEEVISEEVINDEELKKIKQAVDWLEEEKGIHFFDLRNIKYLFWDEYTNFPEGCLTFHTDKELFDWINELKQEEAMENE